MLPLELKKKVVNLPETDNHAIVLVTSKELRHQRFAYRLQKEFGDLVVAWYQLDNDVPAKGAPEAKPAAKKQPAKPVSAFLKETAESYDRSQKKLFAKEVEELKADAKLTPIGINWKDMHAQYFIDEVKRLNPYFFLTLCRS